MIWPILLHWSVEPFEQQLPLIVNSFGVPLIPPNPISADSYLMPISRISLHSVNSLTGFILISSCATFAKLVHVVFGVSEYRSYCPHFRLPSKRNSSSWVLDSNYHSILVTWIGNHLKPSIVSRLNLAILKFCFKCNAHVPSNQGLTWGYNFTHASTHTHTHTHTEISLPRHTDFSEREKMYGFGGNKYDLTNMIPTMLWDEQHVMLKAVVFFIGYPICMIQALIGWH